MTVASGRSRINKMSQVVCTGITKRYGNAGALSGVDLTVNDGEFLVLLGPSGCGKSTLLRIIAGIDGQDAGSVAIGGDVVDNVHPRDRNVAMVFQNYALYPLMTVRENLAFNLKIRKIPPADANARIMEVAHTLGLEEYLERRPSQLSGGQRQRVAMGRAMVRNPRVFLFDEPLSNLDARLRAKMRSEIKSLHAFLHTTTIYVTHDQIEAMTMGDRIAVMKDGGIEQIGTPQQIYFEPANLYVATFVGAPEMNIFRGKCEGASCIVNDTKFPLPSGAPRGGDVLYCVRPHDLEAANKGEEGALSAIVELVEPTGGFLIVHANVGGEKIVMQIPHDGASSPAPGENFYFRIDSRKTHLFAPETGMRLL